MSNSRTVHAYDYVNHPFERVRDALVANPAYVFRHATAAVATTDAVLHVKLGDVDLGKEVAIEVLGVTHESTYGPVTLVSLRWRAARHPDLYPTMTASFGLAPLSPTETQITFDGEYDPPFGKLGDLLDAALGHRIAEAATDRFVKEVAGWLREELTTEAASENAAMTTTPP